jgi:TPR repeat protein
MLRQPQPRLASQAAQENQLGEVYYYYEENYEEAVKWFERAAEQGNTDAQNNLGKVYYREENYEEAAKWFQEAAEQDNADILNNFLYIYYVNKLVDKNLNIYIL